MKQSELDVVASKSSFSEDAAHDWVIEYREDEVFELSFQQRRRLALVLVLHHLEEVEALRVAALVGLRAPDGCHERVRHRRSVVAAVVGGFGGCLPVEGDADGEFQGAELEARRVGAAAGTRARVAESGGWE